MQNKVISNLLVELNSNPMFHFSLSSKELFHSNVLEWLWNLEKNKENGAGRCFLEKFLNEINPKIVLGKKCYKIEREKESIDLTISIYNSECKENKCECDELDLSDEENSNLNNKIESDLKHKVYIELKVKSLPDLEQLNRYYEKAETHYDSWKRKKINKYKKYNRSYVLLTLADISKSIKNKLNEWQHIKLSEFINNCEVIKNCFQELNNEIAYYNDYCNLIKTLENLLSNIEVNQKNKYVLPNQFEEYNKYRIGDLFQKYYSSLMVDFLVTNILKGKIKVFTLRGSKKMNDLIFRRNKKVNDLVIRRNKKANDLVFRRSKKMNKLVFQENKNTKVLNFRGTKKMNNLKNTSWYIENGYNRGDFNITIFKKVNDDYYCGIQLEKGEIRIVINTFDKTKTIENMIKNLRKNGQQFNHINKSGLWIKDLSIIQLTKCEKLNKNELHGLTRKSKNGEIGDPKSYSPGFIYKYYNIKEGMTNKELAVNIKKLIDYFDNINNSNKEEIIIDLGNLA